MRPAHPHRRAPGTGGRDTASSPSERGTDDVVVVRLTDDMLTDGVADIRWLLHDALLTGAREVVIDVRAVARLPGPAVASFLSAHRACRARGGRVVLRGADRGTLGLLHRTGLWRVLRLEESLHRSA